MKSNLFALMGGAAFAFTVYGLISFKLLIPRQLYVCGRTATLRDLYEDNKISCERQGGVDLYG